MKRSRLESLAFDPLIALVQAPGLRTWLAIVGSALAIGTMGFVLLEGWDLSDAFYMTVISVTTVGFKEVRELDGSGRLWTMLVTGFGAVLIFGSVGLVTEYLVTEATSGRRVKRRMTRQVDELREHFVLCGYGRVGSIVANELVHDGQQFVVIDVNPQSLQRARDDGHLVVEGDATADATLRASGIARAKGMIIAIDSDSQTVYVILSARELNPGLVVVVRASTPAAEEKLTRAGADRVVSPYTMAGRRLAELAVRPGVADFLDAALSHGELSFKLEELHVRADGPLDGLSVGQFRDRGLFVLAILAADDRYAANPPDHRRLVGGETVIASGSAGALAAARAEPADWGRS